MRETGALWGASPGTTGKQVEEGLRLLENSQGLLQTIMLGLALQYRSLELEKCRLLGHEGGIEPQNMQIAASLITLRALYGFQCQAEGLATQGGDTMDVKLGAVSILVGLIRLFLLLKEQGGKAVLEESATDPVI